MNLFDRILDKDCRIYRDISNSINKYFIIISFDKDDYDNIVINNTPKRLGKIPIIDLNFRKYGLTTNPIFGDFLSYEDYFNSKDKYFFKDCFGDFEKNSGLCNSEYYYYINGIYLCRELLYDSEGLYCHYCKKNFENDYYYCYNCYNNLCETCYKNKEICTHKIVSKRLKDIIKMKCDSPITERYCNMCKKDIKCLKETFYTNNSNIYYENEEDSFDKNEEDSFDICKDCSNENKKIINEKNLKLFILKPENTLYFYTDFGSLKDWYCILSNSNYISPEYIYENSTKVLINLNPDSENYKKICIESRQEKKIGLFILKDEKYSLEYVLEKINEFCKKNSDNESDYDGLELFINFLKLYFE